MFSLKVVAAVIVIVIIIALVLINFEGIANRVKGVLGGQKADTVGGPGVPGKFSGLLDLAVYPEGVFVIKPDSPIDITIESTSISDFLGEIRVDYLNKTVKFVDSRTPLKVDYQLSKVDLGSNLKLTKLSLVNTKLNITKDGWSKLLQNGTVEVEGFVGSGVINTDSFQIVGNVSKFVEK